MHFIMHTLTWNVSSHVGSPVFQGKHDQSVHHELIFRGTTENIKLRQLNLMQLNQTIGTDEIIRTQNPFVSHCHLRSV